MSSKRASAVSSPRRAKKSKSAEEEVTAKTNAIEEALKNEDFPTTVPHTARIMLAAGASYALGTVVEDRHKMQTTMIKNIEEVFEEISTGFKTKIAEADAGVESKTAELQSLGKQIETVATEIDQATEGSNKELENLTAKEAAAHDAEAKAKQENVKHKANVKEKDALDKEKARYTAIEEGNLKSLIEGTITEEKDVKKACAKLIKDMEKIGTDEALLASVPHVLTMKPDDRKGFDTMVIDSLRSDIGERQKSVDEKIATNLQAAAAIGEVVSAANQASETAQKEKVDAKELLQKANDLLEEKNNAKSASDKAAEECHKAVASMQKRRASVQSEASAFQEVVDGLDFLVKRSKAAMEAEAEPEQASTAVDATAVAA